MILDGFDMSRAAILTSFYFECDPPTLNCLGILVTGRSTRFRWSIQTSHFVRGRQVQFGATMGTIHNTLCEQFTAF